MGGTGTGGGDGGSGGGAPNERLVVQVPDGDVAVAAAAEADLRVGTDGERVAGGRARRQLRLDARRRLQPADDKLHDERGGGRLKDSVRHGGRVGADTGVYWRKLF